MALLDPKEVTVTTQKGDERRYLIGKYPAIQGREIVAKYPLSAVPKLGDYEVNEATMLKLMAFVAVAPDGADPLPLTTRALVDNHVPDWETLAKLEMASLQYNVSFFGNGKSLDFFASIVQTFKTWITPILTDSLAELLRAVKQPSTN